MKVLLILTILAVPVARAAMPYWVRELLDRMTHPNGR